MAKKKLKEKTELPDEVLSPPEDRLFYKTYRTWSIPLLYGISGGILFYFLNPILVYGQPASIAYTVSLTFFCALLAFLLSTDLFSKYASIILNVAFGCMLIQVITNMALTYGWLPEKKFLTVVANSFSIPLGILWFFLLKNASYSEATAGGVFSFREVFKDKAFRIVGLAVLIISGILFFYRLGFYDIWEDENLVINAAIGIREQGLDYLKEGYDRAWLHSYLIAGFFDVFGVSEFTGRLPSALFGILFVLICFYVFTRWFGIWTIAVLIPLVCLMNDRFLILFRYMRMYALLIPVFLFAVYIFYRAITEGSNAEKIKGFKQFLFNKRMIYITGSVLLLLLLVHLQKLSLIILPVLFILLLILALYSGARWMKYALFISVMAFILLAYLGIVVEVDSLKMFAQIYKRIFSLDHNLPQYYSYILSNGLPHNSTLMMLIAGTGLFFSRIANNSKIVVGLIYLLIGLSIAAMVYLIEWEGQDYRYIAHIVPFVVGVSMYTWYHAGLLVWKRNLFVWMIAFLLLSMPQFINDYKRIYVRHPWAPSYSIVYNTLKNQFKPGDALIAQSVKTYYLDPRKLAGDRFYKLPNKKQYPLSQFKEDVYKVRKGWIVWDTHKSYHLQDDIISYIYTHFRQVHGLRRDDYGVELFYFDETMLAN